MESRKITKYMLEYLHTDFMNIMGPSATAVIYKNGLFLGYNMANESKESGRKLLEEITSVLSEQGYGTFKIINFDDNEKTTKISLKGSIEAADKKGNTPICSFISGVLAGVNKNIFDTVVISKEIKCIAKGDSECVFEITPWRK